MIADRQYIVSFIAAAADPDSDGATVETSFGSVTGTAYDADPDMVFGTGTLQWNTLVNPNGPKWQQYTLGPAVLKDRGARLGFIVSGRPEVIEAQMDVLNALTPREPEAGQDLPPGDKILSIEILES